jgi:hypothetical protein
MMIKRIYIIRWIISVMRELTVLPFETCTVHVELAQHPDQSKTISTLEVSSLKETNNITDNIW